MKNGKLIADFGFLKMHVAEHIVEEGVKGMRAGDKSVTVSLAGGGVYRQLTTVMCIEDYLSNKDERRDEMEAVLFASYRQLIKQLNECVEESTGTNPVTGRYIYTPKQTFKYEL